jgi:hypothetical protein
MRLCHPRSIGRAWKRGQQSNPNLLFQPKGTRLPRVVLGDRMYGECPQEASQKNAQA